MPRTKGILFLVSILLIVSIACGGTRDVIGSDEPSTPFNTQIIPTSEQEAGEAQPTPSFTPETQPALLAEAVDIAYYGDDSLYFIGLIKNTGNVDLEFVEIHITLRDSNGTLVASESSYSDLDVIPVGQISPFKVIFFDNPGAWQNYEINIEGDEAGFLNPYTSFEVISSQGSVPSFGAFEIVGEIRNTGDSDAEFVEIIAALYDADNHVIGVDFTFSEFDKVTAGGSSPFELLLFNKASGEVDHYELYVQGNRSE